VSTALVEPSRLAVAFATVVRRAGLAVPVGSVITLSQAFEAVGIDRRDNVYWAGRSVLVRRPEDVGVYDAAFGAFWDRLARTTDMTQVVEELVTLALDDDDADPDSDNADDDGDEDDPGEMIAVRWSATETLRDKDFAEYTAEEFDEARKAMAKIRLIGSPRRSRRLQVAHGRKATKRPDLRRSVRRALRTDGVVIHRAYRKPSERPRRIVLLCDVSGSMESYARALFRFCQAAVVGRGRVEAFTLGTRLTRVTRELASRDPDEALRKASARVLDWSGGTRLGDSVREFNDRWGVRGMARQSIVVVLSDGWDRGEPSVLAAQMERLHRVAYRVVWVNPLKAAPGYQPLARGMAAALPHVDVFIEGHSLASLEELAAVLAQ
jgi:uncharacterized protein